jgi:hypothetical protein
MVLSPRPLGATLPRNLFVERADGEWRGVVEANVAEPIHVLPHYNLLHVAREDLQVHGEGFRPRCARVQGNVTETAARSDVSARHLVCRHLLQI